MEAHGLYAEDQIDFRRAWIICLRWQRLSKAEKHKKQETYCAFIDFEKACDSVEYPLLWFKLAACGIQGKMLHTIQAMYRNLESCVWVNGRLTDWFNQTAGVRQGDKLAPLYLQY